MSVVDNAIYIDGKRAVVPSSLEHTFEELRRCPDAGHSFCWIGLLRPSEEEIKAVAEEFELHSLAVEDTIKAHQRPKLERYADVQFVVLRPARYVDPVEVIEIGEVHLFLGPDFVITVRHAEEPDLRVVRHRLEEDPELLRNGPYAVLYAIMDKVVDDYGPVLDGLQDDIDEIEVQVFDGDPGVSKRIYQLSREVIEFQRAVEPLEEIFVELRDRLKEQASDGRPGAAPGAARRRRPRHPGDGAGRRLPPAADQHPDGERGAGRAAAERGDDPADRGELRAERAGQADLLVGGHPVRADPDRLGLRDELRPHARAALGRSATRSRSA